MPSDRGHLDRPRETTMTSSTGHREATCGHTDTLGRPLLLGRARDEGRIVSLLVAPRHSPTRDTPRRNADERLSGAVD